MKVMTKNFRLNALANEFAAALYHDITQQNGGDWFYISDNRIKVEIIGGIKGVRDLVDAYALEALKENYPHWERIAINLMRACVAHGCLTDSGREIWASMINDMVSSVGGNHA
ncbi:hypothetical protein [Budvicia aquatica]|uniref:Prophage protein n=1 Tax=Budvicia aquatica TaxID=82979 RepID=A0A2C6DKY2_9GAMM|nr:hypothetical protein [Budvicia aquatica]PHI29491.1 hypothetical protein CRN84_09200 [Budvicia aquatica]VFS47788.1 Uncharacterised protein [Budvicia aquatica]